MTDQWHHPCVVYTDNSTFIEPYYRQKQVHSAFRSLYHGQIAKPFFPELATIAWTDHLDIHIDSESNPLRCG
jgi:hypothetical protein